MKQQLQNCVIVRNLNSEQMLGIKVISFDLSVSDNQHGIFILRDTSSSLANFDASLVSDQIAQ